MRSASLCLLLLATTSPVEAKGPASTARTMLVPFESPESVARLERSRHKVDFFRLVNQFEPQQNGGLCGPTSAVIVLNALRINNPNIERPRDTSSIPDEIAKNIPAKFDPFFRRYTQRTFFDERFEKGKPRAVFYGKPPAEGERPDPGLQIGQLAKILEAHGLVVELHLVDDDAKTEPLRAKMIDNLKTAGDFVVVNYHRPALGQPGGGHISPVAAYDQKSDSFLVLDVNATAQPWVWVDAQALLSAMRTKDRDSNRGFILVREGSGS